MSGPFILPERPRVAIPCGATLGESPVWDERTGCLLFVDVKGRTVFRWRPGSGAPDRFPVDEQACFVVPTEDPDVVAVGLQSGIARLDLRDGSAVLLVRPEPDRPGNRLNDACAAPDGAILFGTMDDAEAAPTGRFYRWSASGLQRFGLEAAVTNGPTLDPVRGVIYTTQTEQRRIWRHALRPDGMPGEPEPFCTLGEGDGRPDGCTVDAEGHVWVAHFGGARVTRFSPAGEAVLVIPLPTAKPTKPCFGGPDLATLYITTDSRGADREIDPMAGHVLAVETGIRGRSAAPLRPARMSTVFGRHDGEDVAEVVLRDGAGTEARIIGFGAALRDLVVSGPDGPQRVVIGLKTLDDYIHRSKSFGAVVGRYANRIAAARFRLDGDLHALVPNEGPNQLHGGPRGFGVRVWTLDEETPTHCRFTLASPAGDMGYPGTVRASATYELAAPSTLRVTLEAESDAPTPLNLTGHTYFNLDGTPDIRVHHRLALQSSFVVPVDAAGIPSGEIWAVAGTPFDFRTPRALPGPGGPTYDHTFVLDRDGDRGQGLRHAATLSSERSRLALDLWTTEPGLQVYDAAKVDLAIAGLGGLRLRPFCGLALEAQRFPDGPNRLHFPPCILRPGEVSRQVTDLRFTTRD